MGNEPFSLRPNRTPGARAEPGAGGSWRLEIPAGPGGRYRLAQLDDYSRLPRQRFPWHPPLRLAVRARASATDLPGTWGFGLWNDPFSLSLGLGGAGRRFPALPQAAWFFYASPPNYLSFRDDLPAQGFLAASFSSLHLPAFLLGLGSFLLPLFLLPPAARLLRALARRMVRQDASRLSIDPTQWHTFSLEWTVNRLGLQVDEVPVLDTSTVPCGPLGLVLWIDNQYAALPPGGRLAYGFLPNLQPAWIEVEEILLDNPEASGKIPAHS